MKRIVALVACAAALVNGVSFMRTAQAEGLTWVRAESTHFIVYSNTSDDLTRDFVERLEAFDAQSDKLYRQLGDSELPDDGKHVFYYIARISDLDIIRPGSVTSNSYSFAPYLSCPFDDTRYFGVNMGESRQSAKSEYLNLDLSYTYFAYAHTKNIKFFSQPLPGWVDRGLKYYLMTMNVEPGKLVVGQMLPEMATELDGRPAKYIPFSTIVANTYTVNPDRVLINVESWFLVHWLVSTPENRQKLATYIAKTRDGEAPVKAFTEAVGKSPDDLMPLFKDYLTKGVPTQVYAYAAQPAGTIALTRLPSYGEALPLMSAAMWDCSGPLHGSSLLGRVRGIAKAFPDDVLAQRTLLTGEVLFGDLKRGEAQAARAPLEQTVAAHPDDVRAFILLGRLHLRQAEAIPSDAAPDTVHAEYAAARQAFGKAYKLAPSSPAVLALFARARADLPGYPDDQARQALDLAQSYSDGNYSIFVADYDVRHDDYDGAAKALEDWRSQGMTGKWAQRLAVFMEALKARKPKTELLTKISAVEQLYFDGNY